MKKIFNTQTFKDRIFRKNMSKKKETNEPADQQDDVFENDLQDTVDEVETGTFITEEEAEQLQNEIERLNNELEQKNEQLLRRAAEFDNFRKRTQKERIQLFDDARIKSLEQFLPVYDDLLRVLDSVKDDESSPFFKGVELIGNKFANILEQYGLERIDETGIPFDVNLHDALLRQPAPDESTGSDVVLQVLESGYRIGERVIRHAKVIVSE
jgi:molecular chaperone GrpE